MRNILILSLLMLSLAAAQAADPGFARIGSVGSDLVFDRAVAVRAPDVVEVRIPFDDCPTITPNTVGTFRMYHNNPALIDADNNLWSLLAAGANTLYIFAYRDANISATCFDTATDPGDFWNPPQQITVRYDITFNLTSGWNTVSAQRGIGGPNLVTYTVSSRSR